ncbi:PKD domain-containing protein [Ideonella sp.]|uniref:PKD domain-containing protein n=1 Tax=Ideonella sp. TaxID=1929293 RepID=UPI0037C0CB90
MSIIHWGVAAAIAVSTPSILAAGTNTGLKYISTSGDYIGGGQTRTLTPPGATVTVTGTAQLVRVNVTDPSNWWYLDFAAPSSANLTKGSYPAASRYPFQSPMEPGLSMSGNGRGCNQLKGWFRVREYVRDAAGTVKSLAIDYLQNCEVTGPPLYGAIRYNSKFALKVPTTAAIAGPDFATLELRDTVLDGTQSFTRRAGGLSYQWTQTEGPTVELKSATTATPSFTAPAVGIAGTTLRFKLDTTDRKGETSTDDVIVVVNSKAAPRTEARFGGDPGDYITGGVTREYNVVNSTIRFSRNYDGGVSASVSGDTWWNFDTAAPEGQVYKPGTYANAQRFPFQSATAPGLSLSGAGRGCNTLTGSFVVYQAEFDTAGNPTVADIAFEQYCEGGKAKSYGEFVLNAVPHGMVQRQLAAARKRSPRE